MTKPSITNKTEANVEPLRPTRPCPNCLRNSQRAFFPFCSKRCADLDLNRWLNGAYAIPVVEEDGCMGEEFSD